MPSEITFFNLSYPFRNRFINLLPSKTLLIFIQVSSLALKESINVRQISTKSHPIRHSRLFLSNTRNVNLEISNLHVNYYFGYDNFNTIKLYFADEIILKIDASILNDAKKVYLKLNFKKLTVVMLTVFDVSAFFENILNNQKYRHLTFYGYIPAEYLLKISNYLFKLKSILIKNLNPSFPILNLKELQKFYKSFLSTTNFRPLKFEIIQIVPLEKVINVLALEGETFILHSYIQPQSDVPFLFYE